MHRTLALGLVVLATACGTLLGIDGDEDLPPRPAPEADAGTDAPETAAPVDAGADARADAAEDAAPVRLRRVFVTGSRFDGALGGVAGADAKCQAAAVAAGLPGTFIAYLATDGGAADGRFATPGPWFRTNDGARVFDAGPAFEATPAVPIDRTEDGGALGGAVFVWTGLAPANAGERTCADWSAVTGFGGFGKADTNGAEWKQGVGTADCKEPQRLYCFER